MGEAERNVSMIQDPSSYYAWLRMLQSESRALDFSEKWKDSLRSVNAPERMGNPTQFQDERWLAALSEIPDAESDVWGQVRDWSEFQKYIQASVSIFESSLYEGRAASSTAMKSVQKVGTIMPNLVKLMDRVALSLHRDGFRQASSRLCRLRDKVAEVYDMFSEQGAEKHFHYSLRELEAMPTLSRSQADDLKFDDGKYRVWLSRVDEADGMPYHSMVTVEALDNGRWRTVHEYQARSE